MKFLATLFVMALVVGLLVFGASVFFRAASESPQPCGTMLIITEADTLESISERCGISLTTIYDLNPGLQTGESEFKAGLVLYLGEIDESKVTEVFTPTPTTEGSTNSVIVTATPLLQDGVVITATPLAQNGVMIVTPTPVLNSGAVVGTVTPLVQQPVAQPIDPNIQVTPTLGTGAGVAQPINPNGQPAQPTPQPFTVAQVATPIPNAKVQVVDPRDNSEPYCNDETLPATVTSPATVESLQNAYVTLLSIEQPEYDGGYNAL
jgi:LysM repeat protein